ncbi:hypothetical protein CEUSTIGMA_g12959.t1 [Chlamydomonas eustigma]|uniref:Uncharacterized protein n=1 Tax=Chlamydomonas eustigma TaxID=1157962 RepID=A0A250XR62_9CHLO|nr:hypothetical protein CEUSTIGMA_g12959.t1 [Chlamydomonas eustigma]|eukprot:GAX85544.1 hypothetical protein CEUSTIGMA_g12959.t1 [Chlamydomonas eustigma]
MPISEASVEAIAGALGSVIAIAVTYPLTTVSTLQALDHNNEDGQLLGAESALPFLPSPLRELLLYGKKKGWSALFAGLRPTLAATAISQGVYFYLYSVLRQAVVARHLSLRQQAGPNSKIQSGRNSDIGVLGSILVASLAGCGNVVLTCPVWVVALQMQALQKRSSSEAKNMTSYQVAKQVFKDFGIPGFWKGLAPSLVMVLNPTMQYILYEWLTARLLESRGARSSASTKKTPTAPRLNTSDVFLLTALAKIGSTLCTYPLLLVKSRLQATNSQTDHEARYRGVLDAIVRIVKAEGVLGFFKGMKIKMIQTVLAAALLMSIKEKVYLGTKALLLPPGPRPIQSAQHLQPPQNSSSQPLLSQPKVEFSNSSESGREACCSIPVPVR